LKLPNAGQAIIEVAKVRDYLLSPEHPVGRSKARFFRALGFPSDRWLQFLGELKRIALEGEAELGERIDFGQKYIVGGTIVGTQGRTARISTVWILRNDEETPRLVTAYPEDE